MNFIIVFSNEDSYKNVVPFSVQVIIKGFGLSKELEPTRSAGNGARRDRRTHT